MKPYDLTDLLYEIEGVDHNAIHLMDSLCARQLVLADERPTQLPKLAAGFCLRTLWL
jgi:hypothetical protein